MSSFDPETDELKASYAKGSDGLWTIAVYITQADGEKFILTVGVEDSVEGAKTWAQSAMDALCKGEPDPPDAYDRAKKVLLH